MLSLVPDAPARFPIRFDAWYRVMSSALLLLPGDAYLELGGEGETVTVRMGWAFQSSFSRSAVASVDRLSGSVVSRGVHGFAGRWLVNGSGDRIAVIKLAPTQRARVLGVPVRLRELLVSVDDPDALAERLQLGRAAIA